jgi:hypothetical protein
LSSYERGVTRPRGGARRLEEAVRMHVRHTPGRQFQQVHCALLRQQYLPDCGLLSCAEDPTTVYCSPVTNATTPLVLVLCATEIFHASIDFYAPRPLSVGTGVKVESPPSSSGPCAREPGPSSDSTRRTQARWPTPLRKDSRATGSAHRLRAALPGTATVRRSSGRWHTSSRSHRDCPIANGRLARMLPSA